MSRLGQTPEALTHSSRAVGIWERSGAKDGLPDALVVHAQVLVAASDMAPAEAAYRRAIDTRKSLLGHSHPAIAVDEVALAALEVSLGKPGEALERALRGRRIAREHALLTLGSLPERQALEYARTWPKGLDIALSFAVTPADRDRGVRRGHPRASLTLDEMSLRRRAAADAEGTTRRRCGTACDWRGSGWPTSSCGGRATTCASTRRWWTQARREKEDAERALAERSTMFQTNARRTRPASRRCARALPAGTGSGVVLSLRPHGRDASGSHRATGVGADRARRTWASSCAAGGRADRGAARQCGRHRCARSKRGATSW